MKKRLVVIQDRKDPRNKEGNDQKVPLLNLTGYDAWEVVLQQRIVTRGCGRIFPHNHRSVSAAFTRACDELKIEDLHFHDLRHEGTSRLFEAGLPIEKVALVTGHKDWRHELLAAAHSKMSFQWLNHTQSVAETASVTGTSKREACVMQLVAS